MNELRTVATTKNDTLPLRCPEGQQVVVGAAADPLYLVLADAAEAAQDLLREKRTKWHAIKYHWFRTHARFRPMFAWHHAVELHTCRDIQPPLEA